ncbi:unnamed protein product [Camellia sinensis]
MVPLVAVSMALHNFICRNSQDDEIVVAVTNVTKYAYPDMPDRDDLATLDDALISGDDDVEMAQVWAQIRAELVQISRNAH